MASASRHRRKTQSPKTSLPIKPVKGKRGVATVSPGKLKRLLAERKAHQKELVRYRKAKAARDNYKPRKGDRGKLVFIGTDGQRNPAAKGRKGHLIYVTKTGKKWLLKQAGRKGAYTARKISETEPPQSKTLRNKSKQFQASKLVRVSKHKKAAPAIKGKGSVESGGAFDFNENVIKAIAKSIKKTIESQASKRRFLIRAMVLVKLPDGSTQVFTVTVPIDKPDHISIELGGMLNFVRQKFYAFLAKELSYSGYVTSGSANHIRRLAENSGAEPGEYTKNGQEWQGNELEIVRIQSIDWEILQVE